MEGEEGRLSVFVQSKLERKKHGEEEEEEEERKREA